MLRAALRETSGSHTLVTLATGRPDDMVRQWGNDGSGRGSRTQLGRSETGRDRAGRDETGRDGAGMGGAGDLPRG